MLDSRSKSCLFSAGSIEAKLALEVAIGWATLSARSPIGGAELAGSERADDTKRLAHAAPNIQRARRGERYLAFPIEDERRPQRDLPLVVENSVAARETAAGVGEDRTADAAELARASQMAIHRVDPAAQDGGVLGG